MGVTNRRPSSDSELISCMEMRLLACVTRGPTRKPYQTVSTVYFILGILRMDLWSRVGLKINCHNQNNMFFGEDNKLEQLLPRPCIRFLIDYYSPDEMVTMWNGINFVVNMQNRFMFIMFSLSLTTMKSLLFKYAKNIKQTVFRLMAALADFHKDTSF